MTEIPKSALEEAARLTNQHSPKNYTASDMDSYDAGRAFARYIADVSEKAKVACNLVRNGHGFVTVEHTLAPLILPNPEADLLKEAREICARVVNENGCPDVTAKNYREGRYDNDTPMRCTLAALRKGN